MRAATDVMDAVRSRFRFRASLVGAVLGDCIGSKYEGTARVRMQNLIADVRALHERDTRGTYSVFVQLSRICPSVRASTKEEFVSTDGERLGLVCMLQNNK